MITAATTCPELLSNFNLKKQVVDVDPENVASTWTLNLRNLEHRFVHIDMDDMASALSGGSA